MNVIIKTIAATVIVLAAMLILYSYKDVIPFFEGTTTERLQSLWERDLEILKGSNKLPESFGKVKEIKLNFGSQTAQKWLTAVDVPITKKADGTHRLEIFVDHWTQGKEYGAVIQYQLVNLTTNDTEWELGRTLTLGETQNLTDNIEANSQNPTPSTQENQQTGEPSTSK